MKRMFCIALAIVLCVVFTACGDPTPAEINQKTIKVVLVCAGDAKDPQTQAAAYAAQLQNAAEMVELKDTQYTVCDGVATTNSALAEDAVRKYIKDGYSVVIATETGYAPAMKRLAAEYPRVTFVQVGAADETLPNYYAYRLKSYEGAYMCGLVAGCSTDKTTFGMIATSLETAEAHQLANAFLWGVQVTKPTATLLVVKKGEDYLSAVATMKNNKCGGVLVTTDHPQTVTSLQEGNIPVYTVYGNCDMEAVTCRVVSYARNQLGDTLQALLTDGKPSYNNMSVGYADGFLSCDIGPAADVEGRTMTEAMKKIFLSGKWDVFSGTRLVWDMHVGDFAQSPVACKDTEGTVRILAGANTPVNELLDEMFWWAEGIKIIQ